MRVLIIDNYDSFTYNLYQYVGEILTSDTQSGLQSKSPAEILVKRNNEITLEQAQEYQPDRIIISPGPGSPDDKAYFGICADIITTMGKEIPLLGVCLGEQGIAHCFGGKVIRAEVPMHGKTSPILHDGKGVFKNLPQSLEVMRYHSLVVDHLSLPSCLEITATVENPDAGPSTFTPLVNDATEIMGIRHKEYPIEGIQFHPESFATEGSKRLLENFLINQ